MKNTFAIILTFLTLTIISCNNADKSQDFDKSIMPEGYSNSQADTAVGAAPAQVSNSINPLVNGGIVPGTQQMPIAPQSIGNSSAPQIVQQSQPTVVSSTPASSSGLNPAHGAPGHRCEIPVGSPLNSAPTATVNQPQTQTITTTASPTAKITTAPGMNPAHGEPGHRCDISVGAPLNSKPAEVKTTTPQAMPALTPIVPAGKEISVPAKEQESKKTDQ